MVSFVTDLCWPKDTPSPADRKGYGDGHQVHQQEIPQHRLQRKHCKCDWTHFSNTLWEYAHELPFQTVMVNLWDLFPNRMLMLKWNRNTLEYPYTKDTDSAKEQLAYLSPLIHFTWWRMKMLLICLLQQNLISIQRQKSEVLAATASFYDSFLDVIEFRVTVSTLIHQKMHWRTRCYSCFGFYLIQWRMQKILFD